MVFGTECHFCKQETDSLIRHIADFQDVQIIMVTPDPFEEVLAFYQQYQLGRYANIIVGRDINYFFIPFYEIRQIPFHALYNEQRKLISTFRTSVPDSMLLDAFKANR